MGPKMQFYIIAAFCLVAVNSQSSCPPGYTRDWANRCVLISSTCPPGQRQDSISGQCVRISPYGPCPRGQYRDPLSGQCVGPNPGCPPGQRQDSISKKCINIGQLPQCQFPDPVTGQCLDPNLCPPGLYIDPFSGLCVSTNQQQCPPGMILDLYSGQCTTPQNWLCSVCNECCSMPSVYQQLYQCYFDYQGNFEGCLTRNGFAPKTVKNLISIRSHPYLATALMSFRSGYSFTG